MAAPSEHRRESNESRKKGKKRKRKSKEREFREKLKHYNAFYEAAPPGYIKRNEAKPEDTIPDAPENKDARNFLANAPSKGLWMPLGKEVKVMQCWRCKAYGHRTGDRECPMFLSGNQQQEQIRWSHEDPMHDAVKEAKKHDKEERVKQLQSLLDSSSEASDSSDSAHKKHHKKKRKKAKPESHKKKHKHRDKQGRERKK